MAIIKAFYFYHVNKIHLSLNPVQMVSYSKIANDLAKSYVQAKYKNYAINQIVFEINFLSDPKSKEPLDYSAKAAILRQIHELIAGQKTFELQDGEEIVPEFKDLTVFFQKKSAILEQLKICNKERAMLN
jgi:hypothetical protein